MTRGPSSRGVLIVGAGGFGRETASALDAIAGAGGDHAVGFADDSPDLIGATVAGLPVLGGVDLARDRTDLGVVVTVGNPRRFDAKRAIVERLDLPADRYVTLVHPNASIGTEVSLGVGTIILAGTVVTHGATIGDHVGIMPNTVVTHDDVIGHYAILASGVRLGGDVTIGEGAYVGSSAMIREGVTVGPGAMVGMGSVVLRDVPAGETWVGSPARPLAG